MLIDKSLTDKIGLTKKSDKTEHAELLGAFCIDEKLTYVLSVPRRIGSFNVKMIISRDSDGEVLEKDFSFSGTDYEKDEYELEIVLSELVPEDAPGGLFWYSVFFESAFGKIRVSCDRYSYKPAVGYFDDGFQPFQLTVFTGKYRRPDGFRGGIFYQIFVDRFNRGSYKPEIRSDAEYEEDWYGGKVQYCDERGGFIKNNQFFGGNLYGVAEKLDYIKSLGVTHIYLNPIFKAYSNHKYDTGDYNEVDPMFGGNKALEYLIAEAKKRGIGIILDGVFNHTGVDSRYFNKYGKYDSVGAYQSKDSPYYEWYDFTEYPDKYRCWWNIEILPEVNTENPSYRKFIAGEDGIVAKYMKMGIAGWRLDVVDELSEVLVREIKAREKSVNPDSILIGEVWEDASNKESFGMRRHYFLGEELDSVMNYPLRNGIISFIRDGEKDVLFDATAGIYSRYPKDVSDNLMNFLGTHDTERIITALGGVSDEGKSCSEIAEMTLSYSKYKQAVKKLFLCWIMLATLPGIPMIYYGDEAGMEGYRDPFNRRPYPWNEEDDSIIDFYRLIDRIRREHPVFADGWFRIIENDGHGDNLLVYERFNKTEKIRVVINRCGIPLKYVCRGTDLITGKKETDFIIKPFQGKIILEKIT